MKKILLLLSLTTTFFAFNQNVNIPDTNFKAYLVGNSAINTNLDTEIQVSEALAFTGQMKPRYNNISDLTGIEAFVNITYLDFEQNNLDSIDLSSNLLLETIKGGYNNLTSIDLSLFTNLNYINLQNCNFNTIDFSNNSLLDTISFSNNNIDSVDITNLK